MIKKLAFVLAIVACFAMKANKYKMNELQLSNTFEKSQEVSFSDSFASEFGASSMSNLELKGDGGGKTRGGYLIRAFFCGGIALHRYYMGTNKKHIWALYFCVPVAGGVAACVDFWGAVFSKEFYKKFENNDKWFVWMN